MESTSFRKGLTQRMAEIVVLVLVFAVGYMSGYVGKPPDIQERIVETYYPTYVSREELLEVDREMQNKSQQQFVADFDEMAAAHKLERERLREARQQLRLDQESFHKRRIEAAEEIRERFEKEVTKRVNKRLANQAPQSLPKLAVPR